MKVGVLGSGGVGQALDKGFAALGHDVKMGSREPAGDRIKQWIASAGARASAGTFVEAATFGEVAVLSTRWDGTENAIRLADPRNLAGKIVIDTTNPLEFPRNAPPRLALGHTTSVGSAHMSARSSRAGRPTCSFPATTWRPSRR